jgi:hypothetical protein
MPLNAGYRGGLSGCATAIASALYVVAAALPHLWVYVAVPPSP